MQFDNKENINMVGWSAAENDIRRKQKVSATNGHLSGGGAGAGGGGSFLPVPTFFPESLESMAKRRKSSSVSTRVSLECSPSHPSHPTNNHCTLFTNVEYEMSVQSGIGIIHMKTALLQVD